MRWKHQTVLVTGGTGFIGSFLVERLLDAGVKVRVPMRAKNYRALSERRSEIEWMEGDLRDSAYCERLIDGVDRIFHLASCRRSVTFHEKRSSHVLEENVRMTLALLEALRESPLIPVTFFSTANVPPTDVPALSRFEKLDGYTLGKALCEILWHVAAHERGFPLLIVRPVGVYGPRDMFSEEGNVVPALMVKCMKARMAQMAAAPEPAMPPIRRRTSTAVAVRPKSATARVLVPFSVWGTGREERAFLYVEDLVTALLRLTDAKAEGVQYISSGEVITVRHLAENIRDLVGPGLPIHFDSEHRLGPRTVPLLPPHACLQSMSWTPFEEGLRKTYESWK